MIGSTRHYVPTVVRGDGVEHKVTVLADGFEWEGRPYKSLSAVARAITGTRWNGLTLFGVKRHGDGR
jgi:hypothetical protein